MTTFLIIVAILISLAVIFIVFMLLTNNPYPEEWEKVYEDELRKKFEEHKNNDIL